MADRADHSEPERGSRRRGAINAINDGSSLGTVVGFVVIAPCVYLIAKAFHKEAPAPPTRECPEGGEKVLAAARRRQFCTANLG